MTAKEAIRILEHEIQCAEIVCDNNCDKCLFAIKEDAIIDAYHLAIEALRRMKDDKSRSNQHN